MGKQSFMIEKLAWLFQWAFPPFGRERVYGPRCLGADLRNVLDTCSDCQTVFALRSLCSGSAVWARTCDVGGICVCKIFVGPSSLCTSFSYCLGVNVCMAPAVWARICAMFLIRVVVVRLYLRSAFCVVVPSSGREHATSVNIVVVSLRGFF